MRVDLQQRVARLAGTGAQSEEAARVSKFLLVGVLNTLVGYGAFFILSYFLYYLVALVISHVIGVANSFVWNKYWTFRTGKLRVGELLKFCSVYLFTLVANMVVLGAFVNVLHVDPASGQLVALPLATLASYLGHKYWSFRAA
jgi:putative flippase GtrA